MSYSVARMCFDLGGWVSIREFDTYSEADEWFDHYADIYDNSHVEIVPTQECVPVEAAYVSQMERYEFPDDQYVVVFMTEMNGFQTVKVKRFTGTPQELVKHIRQNHSVLRDFSRPDEGFNHVHIPGTLMEVSKVYTEYVY